MVEHHHRSAQKSLAAASAIALASVADAFGDRDPDAATALHQALMEHGDEIEVPPWPPCCTTADPEVQRAAISCVAWTNAASSLEELLDLGETDEPIRDATITTLTRLGERALPTLRAEATEGGSTSAPGLRPGTPWREMGDEGAILHRHRRPSRSVNRRSSLAAIGAAGALQRPETIPPLMGIMAQGAIEQRPGPPAGPWPASASRPTAPCAMPYGASAGSETVPWLGAMSHRGHRRRHLSGGSRPAWRETRMPGPQPPTPWAPSPTAQAPM